MDNTLKSNIHLFKFLKDWLTWEAVLEEILAKYFPDLLKGLGAGRPINSWHDKKFYINTEILFHSENEEQKQ